MDAEMQKSYLEIWAILFWSIFPQVTKSVGGMAISQGLQITLSGWLAIYKMCILPKEGFYKAEIFCSPKATLK